MFVGAPYWAESCNSEYNNNILIVSECGIQTPGEQYHDGTRVQCHFSGLQQVLSLHLLHREHPRWTVRVCSLWNQSDGQHQHTDWKWVYGEKVSSCNDCAKSSLCFNKLSPSLPPSQLLFQWLSLPLSLPRSVLVGISPSTVVEPGSGVAVTSLRYSFGCLCGRVLATSLGLDQLTDAYVSQKTKTPSSLCWLCRI